MYCLFRFKGEWKHNLSLPGFKVFSLANAALFALLTLQHLLGGETFSFARILLLVQCYFILIPWRNISSRHFFATVALGATVTGASSVYEVTVLHLGRAGSLASNPIPYATSAGALLMSCLCFLFRSNASRGYKLLYAVGVIGASIAIVFSGTRGVWLAVLVMMLLLALPLLRKTSLKGALTTLIVGSLLVSGSIYALGDKLKSRYQQTSREFASIANSNLNTSIGIRLQLWQRGADYILQNPVLGTGTAGYLQKVEQDKSAGIITPVAALQAKAHFHNQYIDTLVRTGVLGLVALLLWMLLPVWLLRKSGSPLNICTLAIAGTILVAGITDVPFHHTHIIYFYSMLMGIMLLKSQEIQSET
ncbi:O-antigen ligase family protein [Oceanisphaera sp. KMM 10153]|uniref:O-antigen ligase family protein n=1 Tax=Oceanisphaera submarina TaxID=3390193 RepID=UPI003974F6AE